MNASDDMQQMTTCPQCGESVGIDGLCDQCELSAKEQRKLCAMIQEAVADRPDLNPRNNMRLTRTETLNGKPVRCYIEDK